MISILYKGKNKLLHQNGVEYKMGGDSDFILLMDDGWNFTSDISLFTLKNYLDRLPMFKGVYADSLINNIYKNNFTFDIQHVQIENIMSPVLIKKMIIDISAPQEYVLKTQNLFYKVPELLFSYN